MDVNGMNRSTNRFIWRVVHCTLSSVDSVDRIVIRKISNLIVVFNIYWILTKLSNSKIVYWKRKTICWIIMKFRWSSSLIRKMKSSFRRLSSIRKRTSCWRKTLRKYSKSFRKKCPNWKVVLYLGWGYSKRMLNKEWCHLKTSRQKVWMISRKRWSSIWNSSIKTFMYRSRDFSQFWMNRRKISSKEKKVINCRDWRARIWRTTLWWKEWEKWNSDLLIDDWIVKYLV